MNSFGIKKEQLSYKLVKNLFDGEELRGSSIANLAKYNRLRLPFATWGFPANLSNRFKDSRAILLSQAGVLKDDDTLDELLAHIYRERGRSETE